MHNNERKIIYREKERRIIGEAKTLTSEQNTINLSIKVLSPADKSLLKKGPSFVPTSTDINWCILRQAVDSFVNKLHYHTLKTEKNYVEDNSASAPLSVETFQLLQLGNPSAGQNLPT